MNGVGAEVMNREAQQQSQQPKNNNLPPPPRGIKRPQDDDSLDDDHRFAKRFHLLNLANQKSHHVPTTPHLRRQQQQQQRDHTTHDDATLTPSNDDCMHLDNTKTRVYIHNLDDELADIEAEEEEQDKLIFLPDIDKHLQKIPDHILRGGSPSSLSSAAAVSQPHRQELVLYSVPSSLSVPEERDGVRKAIIEARERARVTAAAAAAAAAQEVASMEDRCRGPDNPEIAHGFDVEWEEIDDEIDHHHLGVADAHDDPDAMDIE